MDKPLSATNTRAQLFTPALTSTGRDTQTSGPNDRDEVRPEAIEAETVVLDALRPLDLIRHFTYDRPDPNALRDEAHNHEVHS